MKILLTEEQFNKLLNEDQKNRIAALEREKDALVAEAQSLFHTYKV